MLKNILAASALLIISSISHAGEIKPQKIQQSVDDVVGMKSYDRGGIRIFLIDQQEPAARPYKVVVSLPIGGEELPLFGSFEVGSFCGVDLNNATSKKIQTPPWDTRVISIPVSYYNPDTGRCQIKDTLTLEARLMDDNESSLKASTRKNN